MRIFRALDLPSSICGLDVMA